MLRLPVVITHCVNDVLNLNIGYNKQIVFRQKVHGRLMPSNMVLQFLLLTSVLCVRPSFGKSMVRLGLVHKPDLYISF